jgi:hypothetical protein
MIQGKDAPFVLDFVNDAENIYRAFKPYYDKTELAQASDPSIRKSRGGTAGEAVTCAQHFT